MHSDGEIQVPGFVFICGNQDWAIKTLPHNFKIKKNLLMQI